MSDKHSGIEKSSDKKRASITIFRQIVLPHSTESFRRGILLCFRKFRISKNIRIKRRISLLSIEELLSHRTRTFRREPISVSLISGIENFSSLTGFCQVFL